MADISKFLDKAYEGKDFAELVEAPVAALQGVSESDAAACSRRSGSRRSPTWRPASTCSGPRRSTH